MKLLVFLFLLFEIANIRYTSAIRQINQDISFSKDLKNFQQFLKPPPTEELSQEQIESEKSKSVSTDVLGDKKSDNDPEIQNKVQCKICEYMFEVDFNYDKLLSNKKQVEDIKTFFKPFLSKEKAVQMFSNENLEFLMKEVSMQYFFKGADGQFNSKNKSKLEKCEEILGYTNICVSLGTPIFPILNQYKSKDEQLKDSEKKNEETLGVIYKSENSNDIPKLLSLNKVKKDNEKSITSVQKEDNKQLDISSITKLLSQFKGVDINAILPLLNKENKKIENKKPAIKKLPRFKEEITTESQTQNRIKNLIKKSKESKKTNISLKDIMNLLNRKDNQNEEKSNTFLINISQTPKRKKRKVR